MQIHSNAKYSLVLDKLVSDSAQKLIRKNQSHCYQKVDMLVNRYSSITIILKMTHLDIH